MSVTLHDYLPSGNGYKVRLVLRALNQPFRLVEHDIVQGATRTPKFLARNPNGRIPLLELEDGTCISESHAICWYLAEAHASRLLPDELLARTRVMEWLCFEQYNLEPNVAVRRFQRHSLNKPPGMLGEAGEKWLRDGHAALAVVETRLEGREWLVGDEPTLADYCLYAYTHVADEGDFDLRRHYPRIVAWLERVAALPGHVPITWRPPG
jgi:glutathione S-transferase